MHSAKTAGREDHPLRAVLNTARLRRANLVGRSEAAMNFITLAFFIFLAVGALVYLFFRALRGRHGCCAAAMFFTCTTRPSAGYLVLLLCGHAGHLGGGPCAGARAAPPRARPCWPCVWPCASAALAFYKYAGLVTQWLNGLGPVWAKDAFTALSLAVPLGISYFSFMALGYAIDVYRGQACRTQCGALRAVCRFFPAWSPALSSAASIFCRSLPRLRHLNTGALLAACSAFYGACSKAGVGRQHRRNGEPLFQAA